MINGSLHWEIPIEVVKYRKKSKMSGHVRSWIPISNLGLKALKQMGREKIKDIYINTKLRVRKKFI